jgi:hypothetical protein
MIPREKLRVVRFGPLGCALGLAAFLALAYFLRHLLFFLAALAFVAGAALYAFGWSRRALGFRREICTGCGRPMTVRFGAESARCPGCGMIHVFQPPPERLP